MTYEINLTAIWNLRITKARGVWYSRTNLRSSIMDSPQKHEKMYIKFDENKIPQYGFEVDGRRIIRFAPLTNKKIETIFLPKIVEDNVFVLPNIDEKNPNKYSLYFAKRNMRDYITGSVKIRDGCFKGLKNARIVVPFENSVMLDWGSFDDSASIELVLPNSLALKQIYRMFDTGFDYEHENWTLIGDKTIPGQFGFGGYDKEDYSIMDYNEADLDYKVATSQLSIRFHKSNSHPNKTKAKI